MAGATPGDDSITVLTPDRPSVHLTALSLVVHGTVFATKRAPYSPLRDLRVVAEEGAPTWSVGMAHGSLAIPDRTDRDDVVVTKEEIAATGLDYSPSALSLGQRVRRPTTYAYRRSRAWRRQKRWACNVLLVTWRRGPRRGPSRSERRRPDPLREARLDAAMIMTHRSHRSLLRRRPHLVLEVLLPRSPTARLDTTEVGISGTARSSARVRDRAPGPVAGSSLAVLSPSRYYAKSRAGRRSRAVLGHLAARLPSPRRASTLRLLLAGHEVTGCSVDRGGLE